MSLSSAMERPSISEYNSVLSLSKQEDELLVKQDIPERMEAPISLRKISFFMFLSC